MTVRQAAPPAFLPLILESVHAGWEVTFTVTGNSMFPLLRDREDAVILASCGHVRRGDVVLYRRRDGHLVLHRVMKRDKQGFAAAGDAQTEWEYGLQEEQIVAVAVGFIRCGRYISRADVGYRLYWRLWAALRPLRPHLMSIYRRLQR